MSDSRNLRPWIVVVAALGGLGAAIWLFAQAGRSGARAVAPPPARTVADARATSELVRPDEAEAPELQEDPATEAPPEWTPMRLIGVVRQADNERPLADIVVKVSDADGKAVAGARSDEEGSFEIDGRAPEEITVQALPRRGFVARGRAHVVTEEERTGEEEIVLLLARGTSAPVTGVVVNKHTEEGVFEVRVDVSMGEVAESVKTDGNGYFTTEVAFPPGPISAAVFDEPPGKPVALDSFRREHLKDGMIGGPWALRIDIGPSYYLGSTSGAELGAGFVAQIEETKPEPRFAAVLDVYPGMFRLDREASEIGRLERELAGSRDSMAGLELYLANAAARTQSWPEIAVRPGNPPWIRYPRQHVPPPPENVEREIKLHVRGGGEWIGAAEILTTVGHYPFTVGIPLRACGNVAGRVIDTTETPVKEASVKLFSRGSGSELALYETKTNDGGTYSFPTVDVGLYRIVVQPELHAGDERELRVEPGPNPLPTITLPPALIAGDVAGELFVARKTPHERPFLTLASAEGSSWRRVEVANVAARDKHGTLYTFRFTDVPTGEFDLSVGHLGLNEDLSNFWTPRKQRVYPPRDGIRFECRAPDEPEALIFRVTNAAGEPVPHADVVFGPEGYLVGQYELRGDRPFFLPRGVPLQWTVCAGGYQPVRGSASNALKDGDRRVIEVVLQSGWGGTLHVLATPDPEKHARRRGAVLQSELFWQAAPVEAKVYADGRFVGRTDTAGRLDLSLSRIPSKLGIEKPGWFGYAVQEMSRDRDEYAEAVLWVAPYSRLLK